MGRWDVSPSIASNTALVSSAVVPFNDITADGRSSERLGLFEVSDAKQSHHDRLNVILKYPLVLSCDKQSSSYDVGMGKWVYR
jgi:hypothetical protein